MSADNWTICPKCKRQADEKHADQVKALKDAYGKIPADEYLQRAEQLKNVSRFSQTEFREDYEIGMAEDGEFYVSYRGHCSVCEFSHVLKFAEQVLAAREKGE